MMTNVKNLLAAILLTFITSFSHAANKSSCDEVSYLQWSVFKEARGESVKAMRSVLDVIRNRADKHGTSVCTELRKPSQFPYMKYGVKGVRDRKFLTKFWEAYMMEPVLKKEYIYFNHIKHKWGKKTVKIGKLYFSQ